MVHSRLEELTVEYLFYAGRLPRSFAVSVLRKSHELNGSDPGGSVKGQS
jgi:hypothetical protein